MKRSVLALVVALTLALAACGGGNDDKANPTDDTTSAPGVSVYTAVQTKTAVEKVVAAYNAENPDKKIVVTTADQTDLTAAVADGAAEVVIAPDAWLQPTDGQDSGSFGRNLAVIAVPAGNPGNVTDVKAFAPSSGLRTLVCGEDTEIGNFSLAVLSKGGVTPNPDTVEAGCETKALQQLANGELDAALMFRNNISVPEGVGLIDIPDEQNVVLPLSYTVVASSPEADGFATFLQSNAVRQILTENGYLP